ncbi:unnamed protein product [Arctogadus glacialis]
MVPTVVISDAEDMDPTQSDKTCYRKYTDLYSPGVEEDEELVAVVSVENFQDTAVEEIGTTLPLIIANLSLLIDHKKALYDVIFVKIESWKEQDPSLPMFCS